MRNTVAMVIAMPFIIMWTIVGIVAFLLSLVINGILGYEWTATLGEDCDEP